MQTVNAYSQTMRSNYLRGIVLSGFSLTVVNASKVVFISGLAGHHRLNSNAAFVCSGPPLNTLYFASYTHRLVTFTPHHKVSVEKNPN